MSESKVPAWKRLGLKLKNDTERAAPQAAPVSYDEVATPKTVFEEPKPKRKRSASPPTEEHSKKPRKSVLRQPSPEKSNRRKSVGFTEDTKIEDGDSIKQLFGAWVAEQKAKDPTFVSVKDKQAAYEAATQPQASIESSAPKPQPQPKKPKKVSALSKKKIKELKATETPKPVDPALAYLKQFHEDREHWKFQKINQITILKNTFDLDLIPADYSEALYAYIGGLKGVARVHLRDRALKIRDEDVEAGAKGFGFKESDKMTAEELAERQKEYEEAITEYVASVTASTLHSKAGPEEAQLLGLNENVVIQKRMAKRARAERILWLLAMSPGDPLEYVKPESEPEVKRVKVEAEAPAKKVRQRKKRTAASDSESSSSSESESDSDSDSSDSESDSEDEEGSGSSSVKESGSDSSASAADSESNSESSDDDSDSSADSDSD
jgi:hypothetical protein